MLNKIEELSKTIFDLHSLLRYLRIVFNEENLIITSKAKSQQGLLKWTKYMLFYIQYAHCIYVNTAVYTYGHSIK